MHDWSILGFILGVALSLAPVEVSFVDGAVEKNVEKAIIVGW